MIPKVDLKSTFKDVSGSSQSGKPKILLVPGLFHESLHPIGGNVGQLIDKHASFINKPIKDAYNATSLINLENNLKEALREIWSDGIDVERFKYDWRESVLFSGAKLAERVFLSKVGDRGVILIGHGLGGLVCRVANAFLTEPGKLTRDTQTLWLGPSGYIDNYVAIRGMNFENYKPQPARGIVTIATPNSGAMLQGQVAGYLALIQKISNVYLSAQCQSVNDLTTDKIFRFLQYFSTTTPLLSISGSSFNRFALGKGEIAKWAGRAGINLLMPHDGVVEDISVDLSKSILPNEVIHLGKAQYFHLRAYEDCTDVGHINIEHNTVVAGYIADFITLC